MEIKLCLIKTTNMSIVSTKKKTNEKTNIYENHT